MCIRDRYKGGPVSRETIFFLHTLKDLEGALPLGNGLYLNGDFNAVQQYIPVSYTHLDVYKRQTKDSGVDVYTHGEMLPAHYYPAFKKYTHFAGNYGNCLLYTSQVCFY